MTSPKLPRNFEQYLLSEHEQNKNILAYSKHVDASAAAAKDSNGDALANDAESRRGGNMRSKVKTWVKRVETNMWSKFHFLQSLLYSIQG